MSFLKNMQFSAPDHPSAGKKKKISLKRQKSFSKGNEPSELQRATQTGDYIFFKELVQLPFYVKDELYDGLCPLHWSIILNRPLFLKLLLSKGSNPNVTVGNLSHFYTFTPLHLCAYFSRLECSKLLIKAKCNQFPMDNKNRFPFDYAREGELLKILLNHPKEGKHEVYFSNGCKYIGEFKDGKPHGKGKLFHPHRNGSGLMYDGDWVNGKREGFGFLYYTNGKIEYACYDKDKKKASTGGYWLNGRKDDFKGRLMVEYFDDGQVKFIGKFKDGKYDGRGKVYRKKDNSSKTYKYYSGSFKEGRMEGEGSEYYSPSGLFQKKCKKYTGFWKNNLYDGEGILFNHSRTGSVRAKGFFVEGKYYEKLYVRVEKKYLKGLEFMDVTDKDVFKRIENIGTGGQAVIYKYEHSGKTVCVKKFKREVYFEKAIQIFKEKIFHENHQSIIKFLGYCNLKNFPAIILEYGEKSLNSVIMRKELKGLNEKVNCLIQIAEGLLFLHEKCSIVHRDVNPRNVMCVEGQFKIIDFALSREKSVKDETMTHCVGTFGYIPPEQYTKKYGYKADIFSFGVLMYQVLFDKINAFDTLDLSVKKINDKMSTMRNFRPLIEKKYQTKEYKLLIEIMKHCWFGDILLRPTSRQLVGLLKQTLTFEEFQNGLKKDIFKLKETTEGEIVVFKKKINERAKELKKLKKSLEKMEVKIKEKMKSVEEGKEEYDDYSKECDEKIKEFEKKIVEIKKERMKRKGEVEHTLKRKLKAKKKYVNKKKLLLNELESNSKFVKDGIKKINNKFVRRLTDCNQFLHCMETIASSIEDSMTTEMIPNNFYCKLSGKIMTDPVSLKCDKDFPIEFEKKELQKWFESNKDIHPILKTKLENSDFVERDFLKSDIVNFFEKNIVNNKK